MSPENQKEKVREIARDFEQFAKVNLKIRTKDGRLISLYPFKPVQKVLVERVLEKLEASEPVRFIVLKARQQGVSTIVEALIYWWTVTHKYQQSKIIAHNTDTSGYLYAMFRTFYDNSHPSFKPAARYNTRNDITFDNEHTTNGLKSQIDTATAENAGTGRGQTVQWLHGSEVALWPKGQEIVAGLMQAVPMMANTAVFLESTANGIGDYFHTTWEAAQRGESTFEPLFFPWTMDPEYTRKPPVHFRMTQEEIKVKKEHHLTPGQVYWRRMKMLEFVGDEKRFYQEYPLTDTEAFLASGTPRFDVKKLTEMQMKAHDGQTVELYEEKDQMQRATIKAKPSEGAPLKIWAQPQEGHEYVIGADVAEGVGEDFSCATIMDRSTHQTVARFRGDIEPADFGELLALYGRWYNHALIGAEINNHGLTTVQRLRDVGYDNIYRRELGIDERYEEYTSKLGWKTTVITKPLMIDALSEAISMGQIVDYDKIFIRECMTYIRDARGRTNAQEGQHDDTVIATAIALQLFEWNPINERKLTIKSKLPAKYTNIRKNNRALMKKKPVVNR